MKFPKIKRIEDVLPAIEGRTEFVVAEKDGYTILNYLLSFADTFPDLSEDDDMPALRRECRGLVFDRDGKLISRPYAKFFNINEREETLASNYHVDRDDVVIMDKLDGSFIRPVRLDGIIRLMTKMGITEQSQQAEDFLEKLPEEQQDHYHEFFETYVDHFTPIFEFCSRKNQVVIDYPEDALVLTGMRHNESGDYITYRTLKNIANVFHVPIVETRNIRDIIPEPQPLCITRLVDAVRTWKGIEGVVVGYNDGRKIKIKAEEYCTMHSAKDGLLLEKNVLKAFLEQKLDDTLPLLDEAFKDRVVAYTDQVAKGIEHTVWSAEVTFRMIQQIEGTRKDKALAIKKNVNPFFQSIMFSMLDGKKTAHQLVVDKLLANTNTQNAVDSIRDLIGKAVWA